LSHNGASDAQASVYLWVGVAVGVYVRAQVGKPGYCLYCLIVNMDCEYFLNYLLTHVIVKCRNTYISL